MMIINIFQKLEMLIITLLMVLLNNDLIDTYSFDEIIKILSNNNWMKINIKNIF